MPTTWKRRRDADLEVVTGFRNSQVTAAAWADWAYGLTHTLARGLWCTLQLSGPCRSIRAEQTDYWWCNGPKAFSVAVIPAHSV